MRRRAESGSRRRSASAPEGEVVISDVAPEMTAIAADRAEALGLGNVQHARCSTSSRSTSRTRSYDVVLCREGLMLVARPGAVRAREIGRVLRPGGRFALAVWGPREQNPWLGVVFDAVGAELGTPVPPPGFPGPFSLDDAGGLAGLFADAGLTDVDGRRARRRRTAPTRSRSGGPGRARSPGRSRRCSPRCRTMRKAPCSLGRVSR